MTRYFINAASEKYAANSEADFEYLPSKGDKAFNEAEVENVKDAEKGVLSFIIICLDNLLIIQNYIKKDLFICVINIDSIDSAFLKFIFMLK